MEVDPRYQRDPQALSLLYVRSPSGQLVPLSTVAKLDADRRPARRQPLRPAARR